MDTGRTSELRREDIWAGLRLGLEASPACLLVVDAGGTIRIANAAAREIFGYSSEELTGQPIEILVPEDVRERHVSLRDAYIDAPDARSLGHSRSISGVHRDGSIVSLEIRLNPLETEDGTFVVASVFDFSTRRQIERERDRVFELTGELILVTGPDGLIQHVNPAVGAILGYGAEELTGRPFMDFVHPDDREASAERFQSRLRGEHGPPAETRCLCRDGSFRVILWGSAYDPERQLVYGVGHDITDRKREEEALRQATVSVEAMNRELEAFSYSISHDLRAPLRAIDGFSLALFEDYAHVLDAEGLKHLQRVRRAAQRMSDLIEDLLRLSRISRREPKQELVDLSQLVEEAIHDLREREPERRVEVHVAHDVITRGDRGLLDIALRNLVDNAWKYSAKREDAEIEFGRAFVDGEPAYFVRDNGVGFDMALADRLFGAFQRLHPAEDFQGTGIGLATVQRIVNVHGGRLWADATVDEGAQFTFTLRAGAEQ
jgi:PAS domain S-box-containing protein